VTKSRGLEISGPLTNISATHQICELRSQPLTHLNDRERVPETGEGQFDESVPVLDVTEVAPVIDGFK
jgi:hypothetical protein